MQDAARRLGAAGIGSPRLDARLLLEHAGGDATLFEGYIARRAACEPLAYITGHKEFWSLDFEVGPGVLIPRPETEIIVEQVLAFFPDRTTALRVADLGTGTGCLPVSILKEFPNAHALGVDMSGEARACALRNVARHGLAARCEIRGGDWAETIVGPWDVIVTNPPYIRTTDLAGLEPEVSRHEPVMALDGGPDGLSAYRTLASVLARLLHGNGLAFIEIGAGQSDDVSALLTKLGLETVHIAPDLAGIPRVLVTRRQA